MPRRSPVAAGCSASRRWSSRCPMQRPRSTGSRTDWPPPRAETAENPLGAIIRAMARDPLVLAEKMPSWAADGGPLDPLVGPQCSLAVQLRRATGAVIGRTAELDAIAQELHEASGRLAAVTLEGEPGIGKTRLLLAAAELASASGFTCVAVTADDEIRAPFLGARALD